MNNKLLLVLASALTWAALSSSAQTAAPAAAAPSITITATGTVVSQYMFRGQRLGGLSAQPVVEAAAGAATVGLWSNFPLKDEVPDVSDPEFDLYASYTFAVNDAVSFVPGFTYYLYPDAPTSAGFYRGTFEPSLALNFTMEGVKLTPKIYYDITLHGPTYEFTAAYTLPLKELGTELNFAATAGTYLLKDVANGGSPRTKAWGEYWLLDLKVPFVLTPQSKLILGFTYTEGRDAFFKTGNLGRTVNGLAISRGFGTVSYSYTF